MSYIVPIHRPSGVRHALKLSFLSPSSDTLIVAKANRLEVYSYDPSEGLTHIHTRSVYGYITMLEKLRPASSTTDDLFVGTDRYQYFTCSWDADNKQIKTESSYVDQADKVLRDTREMDRCQFDPTGRFMTLELYDGIITIVPVEQSSAKRRKDGRASSREGTLGEPLQVRIEELLTRSSAFVQTDPDSTENPKLAILWEDNQDVPQLKIREIKYYPSAESTTAELETVAELREQMDGGVSHLIPIAAPWGGFLLLGENIIAYTDNQLKTYRPKSLEHQSTLWSCWTKVDDKRYLLADDYGKLFFIMLETDSSGVVGWKLDYLGTASKASCLVYLDEGYVFVGSFSGDSQMIQIVPGGVKVLQTFPNIAPILDFSIMDLGRGAEGGSAGDFSSGQARIVAACGAWQDGTIRSVRSGVGMEEIGAIAELAHITELFALNSTGNSSHHDTLVATFVNETKVIRFNEENEIEELQDFNKFKLSQPTLLAANLPDQRAIQVCDGGLKIVDLDSSMQQMEWRPPDGNAKITAAAANSVHLLVVEGGHTLHVFHTANNNPKPTISKTFPTDSQISSVTIPDTQSNICIVSFWQSASIAILDLHSLEVLQEQSLGEPGTDIPRSVLVANILPDAPPTLFIAMADGTVVTFSFDSTSNTLSSVQRILLGTEPVFFKLLPHDDSEGGLSNVFASCEQPSLIYSSEGRIVYSAVSSDKASRVCYFNSPGYPGAIAIATPDQLKLAMIGKERATQLQTLPIGQTVRCLAYEPQAKLFGIGCIRRQVESGAEILYSSIKIADEVNFKELDSVELERGELVECIITTGTFEMGDEEFGDMFVVGTAIISDDGDGTDQSRGRIIVFEVNKERKIRQVTDLEVKGACRSLAMCDGKIVAGLVKAVVLYGIAPSGKHSLELKKLGAARISTNPLALSITPATPSSFATIAIADLMKSLTIVEVHPPSDTESYIMKEVARHFASLWSSSCTVLGDNEWLVSDMDGNLAILKRNLEGVTSDDRKKLSVTGEFRLGEVVNKIVPIHTTGPDTITQASTAARGKGKERARTISSAHSIIPNLRTGPIISPKAFLSTVEGAICLFGSINPQYQDVLLRLQSGLANKVKGLGYMPWSKWRAWKTEVREEGEPFRCVDGEMIEQGISKLTDIELVDILREAGLEEMGVEVEEVKGWGEELRRLY